MRKIPGAGMRRYPLQSLTQTQGKTVWVRYGSPGKSGEKEEQAGHRALPVPACGGAQAFSVKTPESCPGGQLSLIGNGSNPAPDKKKNLSRPTSGLLRFFGADGDTGLMASPKGNQTEPAPLGFGLERRSKGAGGWRSFLLKAKKNVGAKRTLLRRGWGGHFRCPFQKAHRTPEKSIYYLVCWYS